MIDKILLDEITQYCKLNNIEDVNGLINKMLRNGFVSERFGSKPNVVIKKSAAPVEDKVEEPIKEEIAEPDNDDIYGED